MHKKIFSNLAVVAIIFSFFLSQVIAVILIPACGVEDRENEDDTSWLTDEGSADYAGGITVEKGMVHFGSVDSPERINDFIIAGEKHIYHFQGVKDGVVRIEMRKNESQMDPSLALILPGGGKVAPSSWQNAEGKDAIADHYVLPEDGEYRIIATTYRLKSGGDYELVLTCQEGTCEPVVPAPWIPSLRSITMEEAETLAETASSVKFVEPDGLGQRGVAWAWIQENCNRRASMVNFALSQGTEPSVLPLPIETELAHQIIVSPAYDSAQIYLTGPLHIKQQYVLPDGTKTEYQGATSWDHHIAAVVNVEGTLMVIDPSLIRKPISVEEWIYSYIVDGIECPLVDDTTFGHVKFYYTMRNQFNAEKPSLRCAYTYYKPFGLRPDQEPTEADVAQELEDSRSLLYSNSEYLRGTLNELTGRNIPVEELPLVTSNLIPMDDPEYCESVNYSPRWCAEYRP